MLDLYNKFGYILAFLVLVFILQTAAGDEITQKALLLVLFSMIILNAGEFTEWFSNNFKLS